MNTYSCINDHRKWIDGILDQYYTAVDELSSLPMADSRLSHMLVADRYDIEISADVEVSVIRLARDIRQLCRSSLGHLKLQLADMAARIDDDIGDADSLILDV